MTAEPTLESARVSGQVVTATEWNTMILQEGHWTQEVVAGTSATKIPSTAFDQTGTPTFSQLSLTYTGQQELTLRYSGYADVNVRNFQGGLYLYGNSPTTWTANIDSTGKLNVATAGVSGTATIATLSVTGNATVSGAVQVQGGATIYSGSGAPGFSASTGSMYLRTDASPTLYMRTGSGTWGSIAAS